MSTKIRRRRRSVLSAPASDMRKVEKAAASDVDFVFLDLEDGVAPVAKPEARRNAIRAFNELNWGETVRCFRMNGLDTAWAHEDLIEVVGEAGHNIDTLVIPKVKYVRDVHFVETLLEQLEQKHDIPHKIGFELLIEEVEGVANIREISLASDRVESLMFGIGDYTRAQGVDIRDAFGKPRYYPGDLWHHQRSSLAVAARMAGCDYVDGPWALIPDMEGYRRECRLVKTLGGVGKWAIHPSQIAVSTEEFSPSKDELLAAVTYIGKLEEARANGTGAIKTADGTLLDEATLPMLQQIIDTANFYGMEIPPAP